MKVLISRINGLNWRCENFLREIEIPEKDMSFQVETAEGLLEKMWGLSFRRTGKMLFIFDSSGRPMIDMMLVQKPLNLYFADSDRNIIDIRRAEPWTLDPRTWRTYRPAESSKYLLESFEDLGLDIGDELVF